MNIQPLFSVPIGFTYDFITEKERSFLYHCIKDITHIDHKSIKGNGKSTHGIDFNLRLDKDVKSRLHHAVNEYAQEYGIPPVKLTKIWSNIQDAGSTLDEHTHQQSIISGALYVKVDHTCKLYVHNPNPYVIFTRFEERNQYNFDWYSIEVRNCQLVLFPSWLKHGKNNEINQMDDRVVVSFNCA